MDKNILIIKLGAIGDVLMATPSFKAIRNKYTGSKISLLIGKWSSQLIKNNPDIDEIIEIDENIFWDKKLLSLISLYLKLLKKKFDIVYIMHWSNLFNLFCYLLFIPERIGFDRDSKSMFLTKKICYVDELKNKHIIKRYLDLVDDGLDINDYPVKIYLTEKELESAKNILQNYNLLQKNIIGVAPGGGINPHRKVLSKRWPKEKYTELINSIHEKLVCPVILFGAESDIETGDFITSNIKNRELLFNFIGKYDIRTVASLMTFCKILITNDSGLLHVAGAVNIPTLSIFGPTIPYDKIPLGETHKYIYKNLKCSPCYRHGKTVDCKTKECLELISVGEVFEEVQKNTFNALNNQ